MEKREHRDANVAELGRVSTRTQAGSTIGAVDQSQPLDRYLGIGMQAAD